MVVEQRREGERTEVVPLPRRAGDDHDRPVVGGVGRTVGPDGADQVVTREAAGEVLVGDAARAVLPLLPQHPEVGQQHVPDRVDDPEVGDRVVPGAVEARAVEVAAGSVEPLDVVARVSA